jgi:hypothetical protein
MTVVTYYTFQGITKPEGLKLAVFPSRETIYLCSTKSGMKFVDVSGFGANKFYDSESEMQKCVAMSQDEFDATMIKTFQAQGYQFLKKETDEKKDGN